MMWLEMLVIALLALELTDSPFLVSFTFFLRFIPMLFGFGMGVIAERINRKYLMTAGLVLQAAVSAALATLIITGSLEYWHLAVGSFLIGAVMASEFPVRRTMIAEVVDRSSIGRAISLEQTTNSLFRILGPFIGGLFLVTIGAQGGFLLGVVLYLIGALISLTLKYRRPEVLQDIPSPKTQVVEGVVLRGSGGGPGESFTVRRVTHEIGVERTFMFHSPNVEGVKVVRRGIVRRARLYYLRGLSGRAARIKERRR